MVLKPAGKLIALALTAQKQLCQLAYGAKQIETNEAVLVLDESDTLNLNQRLER